MNLREIKELMASMSRSQVTRLAIKREGFEIELERKNGSSFEKLQTDELLPSPIRRVADHLPASKDLVMEEKGRSKEIASTNDKFIHSPMVGTFYAASGPDKEPFVKIGSRVEKGTVVCIIEAMKVMNEVKSTESGTIVEILIRSEEAVEFGSKLFRVQPDA